MSLATRTAPSVRLKQLLAGIANPPTNYNPPILGLSDDSRTVVHGGLFVALAGQHDHGLDHLQEAIGRGAAAVIWESDERQLLPTDERLPLIEIEELRSQLGTIAARFHHHPAEQLVMVGVTGTNGKSSVTHLVAHALERLGVACGLIGTLGYGRPGALAPASHTTPPPITLQQQLAGLVSSGCRAAAVEVSSHALDQGRTGAIGWQVAAFTNLGRDHLDYHRDMNSYRAAKRRLFTESQLERAVINLADPFAAELLAAIPSGVAISGCYLDDCQAVDHQLDGSSLMRGHFTPCHDGIRLELVQADQQAIIDSRLLGRYNAENLLLAASILCALGHTLHEVATALSAAPPLQGRMEAVASSIPALVVVDYAHTADGLAAALGALRDHVAGEIVCLFGCGGERDRGKRPLMGAVAERCAARVVVTDDNPRCEDPAAIVEEILAGMREPHKAEVIHDREQAIGRALTLATAQGGVLIAGKGHEQFQQRCNERRSFSDQQVVTQWRGEVS
jgi:UDP-N-acetylmuramoyl-L-alanyl-D-glutamate--2,6-diaminopimelate ligase